MPTPYYTDNFDATTAGTLPTGWASISGAWQVGTTNPVSPHTHSFGSTAMADGNVAILTGITAVADMEVTYDLDLPSVTTTETPTVSPMLRMDAAENNGYLIIFGHSPTAGSINGTFFRRVGGVFTNMSGFTIAGLGLVSGSTAKVRARVQGSTLSFKLWNAANPEPTSFQASYNDTNAAAITAAGFPGLYNALDGASPVALGIDDFSVGPIPSSTVIAANNAALVYSSGNWNVTGAAASTINAGAYVKTLIGGTATCTLNFNVANNSAPLSQIRYRIDGDAWTIAPVAASISCAMPATINNADIPYHFLEVEVKSTSEALNRWNAPSNTAVVFTGLTLDGGATVAAPVVNPINVWALSDSIFAEGVRTLGESAANDTDRNDAQLCPAYIIGKGIGAELTHLGFGGTGLTLGEASSNVPPTPTSIQSLMGGVARVTPFVDPPNVILIALGHNDYSATASAITAALTSLLNYLITGAPNALIVVLRPLDPTRGTYAAPALQAGIAACSSPQNCVYLDTTGVLNPAFGIDSIITHPSGPNNQGQIGPKLLAMIRPLIAGAFGSALPVAAAVNPSDTMVLLQGNVPKAVTATTVKQYVAAGGA